ncbi:hypothetical protein KO566_02865 [Flavobacteriaceae bacterium XHP0103]|uniref:hypothetical protein n=1 Tax=Marixanthotalea marina TaxID=2844359 RepID=UPI002989FB53|nr:hypothetical protein [Marixanthotalea marina]MBU3820989.1 hypothetical protein [Marixanthotalea marina]
MVTQKDSLVVSDVDSSQDSLTLIYNGILYDQTNAATWFSRDSIIANYTLMEAMELKSIINDKDLNKLMMNEMPNTDVQLKDVAALKNVWKYSSHVFGYIPTSSSGSGLVALTDAHAISADKSLIGSRVKVTLDRLVVMDYPGNGEHSVLMDFYAKNQLATQTEHVHFNQVYRIMEGQEAGISGYPVFVGLNVGKEGVEFKCYTVNVENKNDKMLVQFLEGDIFKSGLQLLNQVNPITPVLSDFSKGFTQAIANRHKNIPVQDIFLGLDFTETTTRPKMAEGSYVVVQVDHANAWDWSQWVFNRANGQLVSQVDSRTGPQFNYFIFSISKME